MNQIIYISDNIKKSVYFIKDLFLNLEKLGIKNIKYDRWKNYIIVGNTEIRGITIHEDCLFLKIHRTKYFIDGIDMMDYKGANKEWIDMLTQRTKEVMMHFSIEAKQLNGKNDLIKILMENNAEVAK